MSPYDCISFDESDWALQGEQGGARVWWNSAGDGIGLYYFPVPPDIQANPHSIDDVRRFYRDTSLAAGLGMIEVDTPQVDGCLTVRTIFKSGQQPHGMTYIGSITLPFRDVSYVLKVQCRETGITGMREAVVLDRMMASGQVTVGRGSEDQLQIHGWSQDPYDPAINAPLMRNLAENEHYDAQFPHHPLSRLRSVLRQLQPSLRLAPELKEVPPFVYPPATPALATSRQDKKP